MSPIFRHFSLFIVLSLLLHLGVFFYFATRGKETTTPAPPPVPFFVDLREAEFKPLDLDTPIHQKQTTPRTQPGRRLGASDQVAEREVAPIGTDTQDSMIVPPSHKSSESTTTGQQESAVTTPPPVSESGKTPSLSRENLLAAAKSAAKSIADLDPEANQKMRQELEEGRAVWIDTEKTILFSFVKRYYEAIADAFSVPQFEFEQGISGVCIYKWVINRAGIIVEGPTLIVSSGSKQLDESTARVLQKASPRFGSLPNAYPFETLTIYSSFDYRFGNRPTIYGERFYSR